MNYTTWEDLLSICKKHKKIVVSGCQRSGTTYATKALAECLGFEFCDERKFKTNNIKMFEKLLDQEPKMVIQAPAILHELANYKNKFLLVIMRRKKEDVIKSMLNHNWFRGNGHVEWKKFSNDECKGPGELYDIKSSFADKLEKINLSYEELKKTKGFVEERTGWGIKQTSKNEI